MENDDGESTTSILAGAGLRIGGRVNPDEGLAPGVRAGLESMYRRYCDDQSLSDLKQEPKEAKRGLWANPHPVPACEWQIMRMRYR